jgi:hypothetical protein
MEPLPRHLLSAHYGEVTGILRSGDFPIEPSSYLLQVQHAKADGASRWFTQAVYPTKEAAGEVEARWSAQGATHGTQDSESGEMTPDEEQPLTIYRVVTLGDLIREGPSAVWFALFDLATSDHEWLLSSELGSEQKVALAADVFNALRDLDETGGA